MTPISEWLRSTRERQLMPDSEDRWTQDYFLDRLREQSGWSPYRSTYSKYENARQAPKRDTLRKFVAFWASRGEPGPDLTPPPLPESPPDLATVLGAMHLELTAMRRERAAVRHEAAALRAQRAAWERGVVAVLRAGAAGQVPTELLDALAPQPRESARP